MTKHKYNQCNCHPVECAVFFPLVFSLSPTMILRLRLLSGGALFSATFWQLLSVLMPYFQR